MSFKPRSAKVPLYSGDYQQRIELLDAEIASAEKALERAEKDAGVRLLHEDLPGEAERTRLADLEAERDALVTEAEANGDLVVVTMQALGKKDGVSGRRRWSDLIKAHPPRDDVETDQKLGVNDEAFGEALVPLSVVEVSDPDLSVDDLLDNLSSAQFDLLYAVAFGLNRGTGSDPKARPRTTPSPSLPETAPSPAASA